MLTHDSARPVSGIRLRRPSHAPSAVAHVVRPWREGHQLAGLRRTSAAEHNKSAQRRPVRCHRQSTLESCKVKSLDRSCFSSTLPSCCSSSKVIISRHTRMQTTCRFMDTVSRLTGRLHDTIVGPTSRTDQSDRPVGPTIGTCKRPLTLAVSISVS